MKSLIALLSAGLVTSVLAFPQIVTEGEHAVTASVSPSSGIVRITYRLTGEPAVVTARVLLSGSPVASATFDEPTGDLHCLVQPGDHVGKLKPLADWPGRTADPAALSVELKAWPVGCPPDYLVADLTTGKVRYYVSAEDLPFGLASDLYRSTRYAMRKVPAAGETFRMGSPLNETGRAAANESAHNETLSADFYMGVFETTIGQYTNVVSTLPTHSQQAFDCPVIEVSHDSLFAADGFITLARAATGVVIDLPTEAQWEFACRAGTRSALNNGTEDELDDIAWHSGNSGYKSGVIATHRVGGKSPNAFALYDLHGNVFELTKDWLTAGSKCAYRGGSYGAPLQQSRSASRYDIAPGTGHTHIGFRLVCPAVAK